MPSLKYSHSEVKVGLFLAFCVALFVVMLVTYGHFAPMWRGRMEIFVTFENISSLRADAPVRYNGLEVGRVKWLRLMHLDSENLDRLPPLAKRDIDNLPLRPEALRKELRTVNDVDFESRCRDALKNRTMIELCLEVLQEGDVRRYRLDDQIRIVSTVFGDTAVEIISGNGAINTGNNKGLLLGITGDFFSNLAKSMGEVKEILSSVTDVVGAEERRSFERAQARLANINARLDSVTALSSKRAEVTAQRVDKLGDDITGNISKASKMLEGLRPDAQRTADNVKAGLKGIQDHIKQSQDESSAAWKEMTADLQGVRQNVREALDQSKPNYEQMKSSMRVAYERFSGLSLKIQDIREIAGRLMSQNEPDLVRGQDALKKGLRYLEQTGRAALENKDLMLSKKDAGEHDYATAVCIYRGLCLSVRRIREAGSEMQETCDVLAEKDAANPVLARGDTVALRLLELSNSVDAVRTAVEEKLLPEFERKKTAWTDAPPPK